MMIHGRWVMVNLQLILMYELLKGFVFIFVFDIISRVIFDDFVMIKYVLIFDGFYTQGVTFFVPFTACSNQICSHWLIWKLLFGLWNDFNLDVIGCQNFSTLTPVWKDVLNQTMVLLSQGNFRGEYDWIYIAVSIGLFNIIQFRCSFIWFWDRVWIVLGSYLVTAYYENKKKDDLAQREKLNSKIEKLYGPVAANRMFHFYSLSAIQVNDSIKMLL